MPEDLSPIALARLASALTLEDAARITGMSKMDYQRVEAHPLEMTIGELRALCSEMNSDGEGVIREWVSTLLGL